MVAGCPRTVSFKPEEMVKLGEEMVEWVKKNNPLHLSMWYTVEKGYTYKQWKTFKDREEFIPYYDRALKIIGAKYLDKTSNVRDGISQRWQRVYFPDLREQEDEDLVNNAKVNAEANRAAAMNVPQPTIDFTSLMQVIERAQQRNIEDNKSKAE